MKVTVIPIVIGALGTAPKCLFRRFEVLEVERGAEDITTTEL